MANKSLFDAFFWIVPLRPNDLSPYQTTKVVWHYPDDVSSIIQKFRDIPQFCFPDLEKIHLERAEYSQCENFTFTLTDADGEHVYGVCLRGLFRGRHSRYDVGRRPRQCLCIITRFPLFSFFRSVLLQVHALALLDDQPGWARYYLDLIYSRAAGSDSHSNLSITIMNSELPDLFYNLVLSTPRYSGLTISRREVAVVPLLESLGIDKFLKLLSVVMCERRVLFIADNVDRLSSSVLAIVSILHPFAWQHVFIPLLPSKLLDYVTAPMPYIIGVRRYLLSRLKADALSGVTIIDVDNGDFRVEGDVNIIDFVGDSGSALKQASESFNMVKAKASGMANILFGKASLMDDDPSTTYAGPKDIVANMISDLKSILNSKPGGGSLQSVASGLLRTLPGTGKSVDELRVQWQIDAEKTLRDAVSLFFVYVFSCLDDFLVRSGSMNNSKFGKGDSRGAFNLSAYRSRRSQLGDSKELSLFLDEFMHSQMFERFCAERQKKILPSRTKGFESNGVDSHPDNEDDLYGAIVQELQTRQSPYTVSAIKQIVQLKSSDLGSEKGGGVDFHPWAFKYTSEEFELNPPGSPSPGQSDSSSAKILERICVDSHANSSFLKIMKTVNMRLTAAVAAGSRGSNGAAGLRTLHMLKALLLRGPVSILSYSLDLLPLVRSLIHIPEKHQQQHSSAVNALEFMAQGATVDTKPLAVEVLDLLINHRKLLLQRRLAWLTRRRRVPHLASTASKVGPVKDLMKPSSGAQSSLRFPSFGTLHTTLKPTGIKLPSMDRNKLRLTPEVAHAVDDLDDDDAPEDDVEERKSGKVGSNQSLFPQASSAPPPATTRVPSISPPPPNATRKTISPVVSLLDMDIEGSKDSARGTATDPWSSRAVDAALSTKVDPFSVPVSFPPHNSATANPSPHGATTSFDPFQPSSAPLSNPFAGMNMSTPPPFQYAVRQSPASTISPTGTGLTGTYPRIPPKDPFADLDLKMKRK